jgi:hypothetical protein
MASDLVGHLEHDELVRPRREPALPPELADLRSDRDHRVRRGLVGQIIEFGPVDADGRLAPGHLPPGDPQQQLMKVHDRLFTHRSRAGQRAHPVA